MGWFLNSLSALQMDDSHQFRIINTPNGMIPEQFVSFANGMIHYSSGSSTHQTGWFLNNLSALQMGWFIRVHDHQHVKWDDSLTVCQLCKWMIHKRSGSSTRETGWFLNNLSALQMDDTHQFRIINKPNGMIPEQFVSFANGMIH